MVAPAPAASPWKRAAGAALGGNTSGGSPASPFDKLPMRRSRSISHDAWPSTKTLTRSETMTSLTSNAPSEAMTSSFTPPRMRKSPSAPYEKLLIAYRDQQEQTSPTKHNNRYDRLYNHRTWATAAHKVGGLNEQHKSMQWGHERWGAAHAGVGSRPVLFPAPL